ncbi:hypothetical protein IE979_14275 [Klebsiella pneumoniae]|uniref:Uncharacterized protein n=1 Tax=Klebsiella pneumoniae TaxID=573 RepID=A0A927HPE6_KLEPN|nr:hypothetical protein [Klebsiella pneumoniae]
MQHLLPWHQIFHSVHAPSPGESAYPRHSLTALPTRRFSPCVAARKVNARQRHDGGRIVIRCADSGLRQQEDIMMTLAGKKNRPRASAAASRRIKPRNWCAGCVNAARKCVSR